MVKRRNWWVAGSIAFVVGVGVGTLGDRNWQRGLAVGAIGLSAVITVGTLQERRKLEDPTENSPAAQPQSPKRLKASGSALFKGLPLQSIKSSIPQFLSRSPKANPPLPAARAQPSQPLSLEDLDRELGRENLGTVRPSNSSQPPSPPIPSALTPTETPTKPTTVPQASPQTPSSIPELKTQLNQVNDRRQQVEAVITVLRQERDDLQSQILEETQQKQNLYRVLSDLEIRKANLEEKITYQQETVQTLAQQKTDLEKAIATMSTLGGEVERLRQEREKLTQEVKDLELRDAKLREDYDTLASKARKLVKRLKQLKKTSP